jgi:hypothetical protein
MNPLTETNPSYILATAHLRSRDELRTARQEIEKQQRQKKAARKAAGAANRSELSNLIIAIRRARAPKRVAELKAQIEAITGREFYA